MPPVYTVSQVVAMMKSRLEHDFAAIDIEAEISNWRVYPSGHAYFALKDAGAQLNAVLFARVPCNCRDRLGDGRRVKVRGQVTIYPQRGECQLKVLRIKIAGEGELMARYLALKAKLEEEGLFDKARKKPLPSYPRRIALVTSPAGAVVHDMCRVLTRRFRNLEITLYPAKVQGADAPPELIAGIAYFSRLARHDVIIVARGGGSFEDLFCFNDEGLVRAIAACPIPVVSAVGHETDFTLCDFVADVRAGTPSIAAELVVPVLADVLRQLDEDMASLTVALRARGENAAQHLDRLSEALAAALRARLARATLGLDAHARSLASSLRGALARANLRLENVLDRLPRAVALAQERAAERLDKARGHLELLSPYAVLERGYSLTTDSAGDVVRDAAAVAEGETVTTRLMRGTIESRIVARHAAP